MKKNSWITDSEETVFHTAIMDLVRRKCHSSETGAPYSFYVLKSPDWCNILPVTEDGKIVMIRQFRIGNEVHTLELPGGVCDPTDPDPVSTALRELKEETGYEPLPDARCIPLGTSLPNPAIQNNKTHAFMVGPVRRSGPQNLDPAEMIDVVEVPISEIMDRIKKGEVGHALMLVTFFFAALQDPSDRFSQALTDQLKSFSAGK